MRIEWLKKNNSGRVILFFNGWGMDSQAISQLTGKDNLLVFYDYRCLTEAEWPDLRQYEEIYVVSWSMGVWAAANVIPLLGIDPVKRVALNGTELPVDDQYGIPVKIYTLTERGLNEKGRKKFLQRMFTDAGEWEFFQDTLLSRSLEEVCEELNLIHQQSHSMQNRLQWDKIYISDKDVIFPVKNQQNFWKAQCSDIRTLPGGHYPFCRFKSWDEILECN